MTAFNEMKYLPIKLDWCRINDVELYVIDNMSDDGTWEWLQDNNVASHRFDTQGAFHLQWLQQEIERTINTLDADWVIYHGADLFFQTPEGIRATIEQADRDGYNLIEMECINIFNTGDAVHEYYKTIGNITMIHKNIEGVHYFSDDVRFDNDNKKYLADGVIINFGLTKSAAEREQTFDRRKKAWELGLCENWGGHYTEGHDRGWIWDKQNLDYIVESKHYKHYLEFL